MSRRLNTKARASVINSSDRPQKDGEHEKNMWSSMLDSVASGKKLPEKDIIVLGWSMTKSVGTFGLREI
jgi:dynein light intermediate chain 1